MAFMTWPTTQAGSASAWITTQPPSPWKASGVGGNRWGSWFILGPTDCSSPPTVVEQRSPGTAVEDRIAEVRRRNRAAHYRLPLSAWHQQVEQNRTPPVQLHHPELA